MKKMGEKIDKAIFPGLQGGPHNNTTAGIAITLEKASGKQFSSYAKAIVSNAKVLADELLRHGFQLATCGTDNHLMVVDVRPFGIDGKTFAIALRKRGLWLISIPSRMTPILLSGPAELDWGLRH